MMYVPSTLMVWGDASATAGNIIPSEWLFRLAIVSNSVIFLLEIVLTVALYVLLKPVSESLSLLAAYSRLTMTVLQGLLFHLFALLLLSDANYSTVFDADQLHALVLLLLEVHQYGVHIWGVPFGLHLFVIGYLVFKSGYLPISLGGLFMIGSLGYLIESYRSFLVPDNHIILVVSVAFLLLVTIAELSFTFWLLFKGVKDQP